MVKREATLNAKTRKQALKILRGMVDKGKKATNISLKKGRKIPIYGQLWNAKFNEVKRKRK